jgi:two-component system chemotaxis sensor kinase CheA
MAEVGGGGGRGDGAAEKAREEFFSEAQELVDGLGRDLLALDEGLKRGTSDPELVNDVFRAVHTLKGLSGLFGAARMTGLSHELEDVLDDLRLGRIELTTGVLDLLFQAVELYARILAAEKGAQPEVEALLVSLGQVSQHRAGGSAGLVAQYDLDPGLLGVLTEYEEHRLRTNIQAGLALYRIRVRFALATIDSALDDLKAKTRPHGEIITYLPTGSGADIETIELEILMASHASIDLLRAAVSGQNITIEEVRRRSARSIAAPPMVPPSLAATRVSPISAPPETRAFVATPTRPPAASTSIPPEPATSTGIRTPLPPAGPSIAPPAFGAPPTHGGGGGGAPGGGGGGGGGGRELSLRSISQTVRVDIRKLDRLMTIVGELAIVRTAIARLADRVRGRPEQRELSIELQRLHRTFDRQLGAMQNGILEVRMVPLGQVFDKLARVVRQISREHDKQVNLVITGAETEIDKLIVEELSDPLMHMIRNAIDHGIEPREERVRVGKPAIGTIALNAFQKGNHVLIEVEDDGRGMDPATLLASAVRKGIVSSDEAKELQPREILGLAFMPGFTTKEVATDLSGRGVGLDVVKTNIGKLGGVVDIASEPGIGTKMTITLPITLAIISVLLVEISGRLFAIPLASVEEAIGFDERNIRTLEGREVMTVRGASLPICRLSRLFDLAPASPSTLGARAFVVIASVGNRRLGFVVDKLVGQQDIVIKALGKSLKSVRGFAGATELGDQRVALVLDAGALIEEVLAGEKDRFFATLPEGRS